MSTVLPELSGTEIVGIGAGAQDFYMPPGEVNPGHVPGQKADWSPVEDDILKKIRDTAESHIGGNAVNSLAWLAFRGESSSLVGVLGEDATSIAIRNHLAHVGVGDRTVTVPGYEPSVSIIEARCGGDRMVRGRPRHPINEHLSTEYLTRGLAGARFVVAASLKSTALLERTLAAAPPSAGVSLNPGGEELRVHPGELRRILGERATRITTLAVNEIELQQLLGVPVDEAATPSEMGEYAASASKLYATHVLCTLGKNGVLLASNGSAIFRAAERVEDGAVVDTLGAGDRAHAVTVLGLVHGTPAEDILEEVVHETAHLVRHRGAHGDLYRPINTAA